MKQDIIIIGAGGLGKEVLWLLEEQNSLTELWNILGFVDDNELLQCSTVNDYPVLGDINWLVNYKLKTSVVCCIAKPKIREKVISKLLENPNINYPNIIAEGVRYSKRVHFGKGNIICLASTLTVDIQLGDFNIINPGCTIGHDAKFQDFITLYPGVNISGNTNINQYVEFGTGSQIIQGLSVCENVIIGAGSVVIRDINEKGTYVGAPTRRIK